MKLPQEIILSVLLPKKSATEEVHTKTSAAGRKLDNTMAGPMPSLWATDGVVSM